MAKSNESQSKSEKTAKEPNMGITAFFAQCKPQIHKYTQAGLAVQFRGTMKTESAWRTALASYIERGV